jgi:predicted outer membrane repeat protein
MHPLGCTVAALAVSYSSGEQPWIKTQGPHVDPSGSNGSLSATAGSWTDLAKKIAPTSGWVKITLDAAFDCSDYGSEIGIHTGANVTIHGNGAELDAARKGRFFTVDTGAALTLDHLVLRHGYIAAVDGGAIANKGALTVTYANFISNSAPDGDGGAIMNDGTLNVNASSFESNIAYYGGAVYVDFGICNIDSTAFVSNTADAGHGGAICMGSRTIATISDANFTSNSAWMGGAIFNGGSSVAIDGSTAFSDNTCGGGAPCGTDVSNWPGSNFTFAGSRSVSFGG